MVFHLGDRPTARIHLPHNPINPINRPRGSKLDPISGVPVFPALQGARAKMELIVARMSSLNLRRPSEQTKQHAAAILILCSANGQGGIPAGAALQVVREVTNSVRALRRI